MKDNELTSLDDLRSAWAKLDQRVDVDFAKIEAMTTMLANDRARTIVRQTMWLPTIELIATVAGVALVIFGLLQNGGAVYYGCLLSILFLFVLLIVSAIWQIATIATIQLSAPVIATQRRLGRVRALRIFENKWMLLLSPVLWAPFLVAIVELFMKVVLGKEGSVFSAGFVLTNVLIGLMLSAGLVWLSHRFAKRLLATSFFHQLLDEFAGRRVTAAREFLARLDGYEQE